MEKSEYFWAGREGLADPDSPPLQSVTRRAHILSLHVFYTLHQRIWKFVPQRYYDFFFFLTSLFKHDFCGWLPLCSCLWDASVEMRTSWLHTCYLPQFGFACSGGGVFFCLFFLLDYAAPPETRGGRNNPNIKKLLHKLKESPSPSTQR